MEKQFIYRDKLFYEMDGMTLLSGRVISRYLNGNISEETTYCNGMIDGPRRRYYENGQLNEEEEHVTYIESVWNKDLPCQAPYRQGRHTVWYSNGQKLIEENYIDNKLDGIITKWHEDGAKRIEATYVAGKRHGLLTAWDKRGNIIMKIHFLNDEEQ